MKITVSTHTFAVGDHAWYMHGPTICSGVVQAVTHDVPTEYGPTSMYRMSIDWCNMDDQSASQLYAVGGEATVGKVYLHQTKDDLLRFHFLVGA